MRSEKYIVVTVFNCIHATGLIVCILKTDSLYNTVKPGWFIDIVLFHQNLTSKETPPGNSSEKLSESLYFLFAKEKNCST